MNAIEGEIETLRNRHMDNMRKIHDLHNSLSLKEKKVIKINDENTELVNTITFLLLSKFVCTEIK